MYKIKLLTAAIVLLLSIAACHQKTDETAAIKKLLEKESATWRAADVQGHADCWHVQPYSRILVSTGDGKTFDVPPDAMVHTTAEKMGKGGSAVNSNYKMNIQGDYATVSHDEVSTAADGAKTYSYEIRLLEKIDGQWKLTGQSIHLYKP